MCALRQSHMVSSQSIAKRKAFPFDERGSMTRLMSFFSRILDPLVMHVNDPRRRPNAVLSKLCVEDGSCLQYQQIVNDVNVFPLMITRCHSNILLQKSALSPKSAFDLLYWLLHNIEQHGHV